MTYKFFKVKRQTECRQFNCRRKIKVRKHMIEIGGNTYCLLCGEKIIEKHKNDYKKRIENINKIRRTLKRHTKERVTLRMVE